MNVEIKVKITGPDGIAHTEKIADFTKGADTIGEIGLSIAESKELLLKLQQEIVSAQCVAYCATRTCCTCCGRQLRCKGRGHIRYRTVLGMSLCRAPASTTASAMKARPKPSAR